MDLTGEGWTLDPDDGFIGHVGKLWRRKEADGPVFAFVATPIHANRNGMVHGGMLMTFVDRAFGQAARAATGAVRGATISLSHQFLAPMHLGRRAEVRPRLIRATSRLAFMEGTVTVDGTPVLSAHGVWRQSHSRA